MLPFEFLTNFAYFIIVEKVRSFFALYLLVALLESKGGGLALEETSDSFAGKCVVW